MIRRAVNKQEWNVKGSFYSGGTIIEWYHSPRPLDEIIQAIDKRWSYTKETPPPDGSYQQSVEIVCYQDGEVVRSITFTDKQVAMEKLHRLAVFT